MDFDAVETRNLDLMIGVTRLDAALERSKVDVAARLMKSAATAARIEIRRHEVSIADPEGVSIALDYDVIFSCVDRPWPRAVLNGIAYADLIPVIDGGIALDTLTTGACVTGSGAPHPRTRSALHGLHRAARGWRSLVGQAWTLRRPRVHQGGEPGSPVPPERRGAFCERQQRQAGTLREPHHAPGRRGTPTPLRHVLSTHVLEHSLAISGAYCPYENATTMGDRRTPIAERREDWRTIVATRAAKKHPLRLRAVAKLDGLVQRVTDRVIG